MSCDRRADRLIDSSTLKVWFCGKLVAASKYESSFALIFTPELVILSNILFISVNILEMSEMISFSKYFILVGFIFAILPESFLFSSMKPLSDCNPWLAPQIDEISRDIAFRSAISSVLSDFFEAIFSLILVFSKVR